jgi:alpha-D-ribose 1-methylphosphonate 5-triphosphate synthase subunit PhnH
LTLLSSLLDNEVAVAAIGAGAIELLDAVAKATGCRSVIANDADFLLVLGGSSCGHLNGLRRGTSDYPETGASVIYMLDEIAAEGGQISFTGPGIRDRISPLLSGLEDNELKLLGEVNRDFPLGIDAIFIDRGGRLTCIPRSTRIGVA